MKILTLMKIHQMLAVGATIDETASATGATVAQVREIAFRNDEEEPSDDLRLEIRAWNRERAASARSAL